MNKATLTCNVYRWCHLSGDFHSAASNLNLEKLSKSGWFIRIITVNLSLARKALSRKACKFGPLRLQRCQKQKVFHLRAVASYPQQIQSRQAFQFCFEYSLRDIIMPLRDSPRIQIEDINASLSGFIQTRE